MDAHPRGPLPWSCDSFVVLPGATTDGSMLFGKNSDRPVGEAQPLRYVPARSASRDDRLRLAYVEIADAPETFAHVGASPYWCWGHELGVNECGVAIGNEALFTRELARNQRDARAGDAPEPGILGMELLRLGLERGRTAAGAIEVMTALLERHGQWGAGVPGASPADGAYDNSFLVADRREAWVLETAGRRWIAARVRGPSWSVSNQATIRTDWDRAGDDIAEHARDAGWWSGERDGPPAGDSYWWTFQRLLDAAKGDALGSAFAGRQARVRETLDVLEESFRAELAGLIATGAGAEALEDLTRRCVDRALAAANQLLERFAAVAPRS